MSFIELVGQERCFAILRASTAERFVDAAVVLVEGGVRCLEFTLTSAGALEALEAVRSELPDDVSVGVGSVRTVADVDRAVDAGADFLVSPLFDAALIQRATGSKVPVVPGALSPTEIEAAWVAGASAVKVFPVSSVGGPSYIAAICGPLPDIPLIPTGGVGLDDIPAYLAAGAIAVGLGGSLVGDLGEGYDRDALRDRARRAVVMADRQ